MPDMTLRWHCEGDLVPVFRRGAFRMLDLLFPRDCPISGEPVDNVPWLHLTNTGLDSLHRVSAPHCETCGAPFFGVLAGPQTCPHCCDLSPVFDRGKTAVVAKGAGRRLVHVLKYRQGTWLARDMARIILTTPGYADFLDGAVLVPVPLHPHKLHFRGYNQAELLVDALAALSPSLRVARLLARIRDTATQTRLGREDRAHNMENAFALRPGAVVDPEARYIVFDDVFTTGATLNACCAVLAREGATRLDVGTFAHG
ncbi:MAG: ComF family protein [Puniceicoccales bacterium]|jgi:ComF family protein|nr:ComF family protein [Puniceicoccales bacterium]